MLLDLIDLQLCHLLIVYTRRKRTLEILIDFYKKINKPLANMRDIFS